jgi:photosystem II stability/assembly factor-like uncharacterized protein
VRPQLFRSVTALAVLGFVILLLPGAALALSTGSGGWTWQNPLPQGALYQRGWFLDARHGWLISGGDIFHTADGGATLTVQSRSNVQFHDITFVDARHGWAVGDPATTGGTAIVFRTTDGRHWKRVRLHLLGGLSAVSFSTAKVGWAVGGVMALHTIDGGLHWTVRKVPHADWLVDVRALGQRHAVLCDDVDAMLRTDDGGRTWRRFVVLHPSQPAAIRFTSLRNGWVSSDQGVLHTSDGGAHWTMQLATSRGAGGLAFANSSVGWATTSDGVFRTVDGGAHWVLQAAVPPTGWAWVLARGTSAAVLGGGSQLTHTVDGGVTWTPVIAPADDFSGHLAAVKFADADAGWTVGEAGEILATTDGGAHWSAQQSATDQDLNDLTFVDANDGWAVGGESDFSSGAASAVVVHTADGGTTWTPQTSGVAGLADPLTGVSFVDASNGWAVGGKDSMDVSDGVVLHTTNGGQSWTPQTIPDRRVQLNGVAFADARHGWAVGSIAGDAGENVTRDHGYERRRHDLDEATDLLSTGGRQLE